MGDGGLLGGVDAVGDDWVGDEVLRIVSWSLSYKGVGVSLR